MISHFYLQRSETRTQRQMAGADNYLKEKCISAELSPKYAAMGIENSSLGALEGEAIPHPEKIKSAEICLYYDWEESK